MGSPTTPRVAPSGRTLVRRLASVLVLVTTVASIVGAAVVAALLIFFVPLPADETTGHRVTVVVVAGGYLIVALVLGSALGLTRQHRRLAWLIAGRAPEPDDARRALRIPVDVAVLAGGLWLTGAVVVGALTASLAANPLLGVRVALTVVLGGLVTAAVSYLQAERIVRPVTIRALAALPPGGRSTLGVAPRLVLTWLLGCGVPLLGLLLLYVDPTARPGPTRGAVVLLTAIALGVGALMTVLAARAVGAPLRALRVVVERVRDGDFDVRVPIDDAGEIGLLQHRVNAMTAGLGERERLADLFGRHVGADVARQALSTGVELGGEERTVAALFVDIAGSTAMSLEQGPEQTVATLNRFFQIVVDAVEAEDGLLNKFEGDAALAVFGAPVELDDAPGAALAAARRIATDVAAAGEVDVGVGVGYGRVVAGQVGATSRLEYTVIGDAVNEAARLTERAKDVPGRVLASGATVDAAGDDERSRWRADGEDVLRGRSDPTRMYVPVDAARPDASDAAPADVGDAAGGSPAGATSGT